MSKTLTSIEKIKAILKAKPRELLNFTIEEVRTADEWARRQAMTNFHKKVASIPQPYRDYLELMVHCHYGSIETDELLLALDCYHKFD